MTGDAVARFEEHLAAIDAALTELTQIPTLELSLEQVEHVLERFYRLTHRAEAVKLHLLRAATSVVSPHAVKSFLTTAPRNIAAGQAERDLNLARFTDPDVSWDGVVGGTRGDRGTLALTGAELLAGNASRAHLDLAAGALTSMPTPVRRGTLTTVETGPDGEVTEVSRAKSRVLDGFLATTVIGVAPGAAKQITNDMLTLLDPDRSDRGKEPCSEALRGVTWSRRYGMDRLVVDITHLDSPYLKQLLRAAARPEPTDPVTGVVDERSTAQREYDGLMELLHAAGSVVAVNEAAANEAAESGTALPGLQQRSTVLVHATSEQLSGSDVEPEPELHSSPVAPVAPMPAAAGSPVVDGQGPVRPEVFEHLTCDGQVRRVTFDGDGTPVGLSSVARAATVGQRQVIAARDRGCVAPGCGKPSWLTHTHHVQFWSRGGRTEVENLVSLCGRHHRQLHSGGLEVRFGGDGRVEARWVRSGSVSQWFRNTVPERMAEARSLALRLTEEDARHT